jgi:hypothetical protein
MKVDSVENGQVKSRPNPPRFPHLTHPFSFFRKNQGAGRVMGQIAAGAGSETREAPSRSYSRDPVSDRDAPGCNPDLIRIFSPSRLHHTVTHLVPSSPIPTRARSPAASAQISTRAAGSCTSHDRHPQAHIHLQRQLALSDGSTAARGPAAHGIHQADVRGAESTGGGHRESKQDLVDAVIVELRKRGSGYVDPLTRGRSLPGRGRSRQPPAGGRARATTRTASSWGSCSCCATRRATVRRPRL